MSILIINKNKSQKKNKQFSLLDLKLDILIRLCSENPILGLTCKQLYSLCPIKPPNTRYNYNPHILYTLPIQINYNNIIFHYYTLDYKILDELNELIESENIKNLKTDNEEFEKLKYHIDKINNFPNKELIKDWKYKNTYTIAYNMHSGGRKTFHCVDDVITSFIMSMMMMLYH